jgi:hypothetical protein
MLTFSTTDHYLLVGGKTVYIKDVLRVLGGKWRKNYSCWTLPIFLDNEGLREALLEEVSAFSKARSEVLKRTRSTNSYEENN